MMKTIINVVSTSIVLGTSIFFLGAFIFATICNIMEREIVYTIIAIFCTIMDGIFVYITTKDLNKIVYSKREGSN